MPEFRKEWFAKAKIDYFAPFVNLWLSCNAWYVYHYAEFGTKDRVLIDKVKSDYSKRNHIYKQFKVLIEGDAKENQIFKSNIQQLHYALNDAMLSSDKLGIISMESAVCDYNNKDDKTNLIKTPHLKKDGTVFESEKDDVLKLETLYIISDVEKVFAGLFEIIYQVRNCLIHGHMNPGDSEYEVVKYCYLILYDLMSF
ncbi:MAG: hypothetical protein J1G02_05665 [Clostridiales bacterium]|nr:hypothetical protein [Clostridiales bacterium]